MIKDFVALSVTFIICFLISAYFDAFEWLHQLAVSYERYELDEFICASFLTCLLFAIFSYRRWQDVRKISAYCEDLSMIDPITMLPNRRIISQLLGDIRAGKNKKNCFPLSLILVNINGLENIQLQMGNAVAEHAIHELVYRYSLILEADHLISYRNTNQCLFFCPEFNSSEAELLCQKIRDIEMEGRHTTLQLLAVQAVSVTLEKPKDVDWALDKLEDLLHARQFDDAIRV